MKASDIKNWSLMEVSKPEPLLVLYDDTSTIDPINSPFRMVFLTMFKTLNNLHNFKRR